MSSWNTPGITHKIKSEYSATNFRLFGSLCDQYKAKLDLLRNKIGGISGNGFTPLSAELNELYQACDSVDIVLTQRGNVSFNN